MRAELPEVSGPGHRRNGKPVSSDLIRRVYRVLLEVDHQLVDLGRLETGDGDVEAFRDEELGELWEFDRQTLPVPPGIRGDLVVRQQQRPLFRLA